MDVDGKDRICIQSTVGQCAAEMLVEEDMKVSEDCISLVNLNTEKLKIKMEKEWNS